MSLTSLNAYRNGGPISGKLKDLWRGIRRKADDPSWGYIGASMLPGLGEATDLVEIGAGIQDRDLGRIGLGLGSLALPFVAAPALRKMMGKANVRPRVTKWDERLRRRHVSKAQLDPSRTIAGSSDPRLIDELRNTYPTVSDILDRHSLEYKPTPRARQQFDPDVKRIPSATTISRPVVPWTVGKITKERGEWLKPVFPEAPWDLVEDLNHPLRANFIEDLTAELGHRPKRREQYRKIAELALKKARLEGKMPNVEDITSALRAVNEVTRSTADPRLLNFTVSGRRLDKGKYGKDFVRDAARNAITDYRNLGLDILGISGLRTTGIRPDRTLLQAATGRRGYMRGEPLRYTWGGAPVQDRGLQYLLNALPIAEGRVFDPVSHIARAGVGYGREFGLTGNALREDQGIAPSPPALPRLPQVIETPEEQERRRIEELLRQRVPPPTFRPIN